MTYGEPKKGQSAQQVLEEEGVLYVRKFLSPDDLAGLYEDIDALTSAFRQGLHLEAVPDIREYERDRPLVEIVRHRPAIQPILYDRLQNMPSLLSLPSHPRVRELSEAALGTKNIGVWPRVQLRFDQMADEKNLIAWHRDYSYNRGTQDSFTFWIPVVDIVADMGMLLFAKDTHKNDDLVFKEGPANRRFNSDLDQSVIDSFDIVSHTNYDAGDLVMFHSMAVHSGTMNANPHRARLTAIFRMQNLNKLEAFES